MVSFWMEIISAILTTYSFQFGLELSRRQPISITLDRLLAKGGVSKDCIRCLVSHGGSVVPCCSRRFLNREPFRCLG